MRRVLILGESDRMVLAHARIASGVVGGTVYSTHIGFSLATRNSGHAFSRIQSLS